MAIQTGSTSLDDLVASPFARLAELLHGIAPGATPVEGGIPLMLDGKVLGAIGVSGATSQQDGQVAAAGVAAFNKIAGR